MRVGGHYLFDKCPFEMLGPGISAPGEITQTNTVWFEGPVIRLPLSQDWLLGRDHDRDPDSYLDAVDEVVRAANAHGMADQPRHCLADGKIHALGGAGGDLEGDARGTGIGDAQIAACEQRANHQHRESKQGKQGNDALRQHGRIR